MGKAGLFAGALALLSVSTAHAGPPARGRSVSSPAPIARNVFGQPDLDGMWTANFLMDMEATPDAPDLVVSEARARELQAVRVEKATAFFEGSLDPEVPELLKTIDGLPLVRGERRTRLVTLPVDGRLPYTAAARKEAESGPASNGYDNPEDRPNAERCLVGDSQPPFAQLTFGDQLQIMLTRDHVLLHAEYDDDVRLIPFTTKHRPAVFKSRLGDSIARWEGNTLVIETKGLPDADRYRFFPTLIVGGDSTVIERFTRVSPRELLYQFTVVDPKIYSAPWSAEFSWYATDKPMYEHACHEGNYSLAGVLGGARREEALKAQAKAAAEAH